MKRPGSARGASAIEFALVLPLFLGVVSILLSVGLYFLTMTSLQRAADRAVQDCGRLSTAHAAGQSANRSACINSTLPTLLRAAPRPACASAPTFVVENQRLDTNYSSGMHRIHVLLSCPVNPIPFLPSFQHPALPVLKVLAQEIYFSI